MLRDDPSPAALFQQSPMPCTAKPAAVEIDIEQSTSAVAAERYACQYNKPARVWKAILKLLPVVAWLAKNAVVIGLLQQRDVEPGPE